MPGCTICTHLWRTRSDVRYVRTGRTSETCFVEIIVLTDELFKLALNIRDLLTGKLKLLQRHACLLQVFEEADLRGLEELW